MRTHTTTTTLYTFDELSPEAKYKAVLQLWDINVEFNWWDSLYDDAENIGLKITEFDLYQYRHARGEWLESPERAAELILEKHGNTCETYQTAKQFLADRDALVAKYSDGIHLDIVHEDNEYEFDQECDELEADFLKSLLEDYYILLQEEYEYLTSEEAIIETIQAYEYEFTEDGQLF